MHASIKIKTLCLLLVLGLAVPGSASAERRIPPESCAILVAHGDGVTENSAHEHESPRPRFLRHAWSTSFCLTPIDIALIRFGRQAEARPSEPRIDTHALPVFGASLGPYSDFDASDVVFASSPAIGFPVDSVYTDGGGVVVTEPRSGLSFRFGVFDYDDRPASEDRFPLEEGLMRLDAAIAWSKGPVEVSFGLLNILDREWERPALASIAEAAQDPENIVCPTGFGSILGSGDLLGCEDDPATPAVEGSFSFTF